MKLSIIQTSDLHGFILPKTYHNEKATNMGLSKISTLIESIRKNNKYNILVDCGDSYQGNPIIYNYIKNHQTLANPMAVIFNHLKYDAQAIGNHEFDYGLSELTNYIEQCHNPWICCNIDDPLNILKLKPYIIKEFDNGLKVGIIGATTKYIPNWIDNKILSNISFTDPIDSIKASIEAIRNIVDVVIVAYHGGLEKNPSTLKEEGIQNGENQGFEILSSIEGIDVLLLGHQHRLAFGKYTNIPYVMPLSKGSMVGLVELELSKTVDDSWHIVSSNCTIEKVDNYSSDTTVENLFAPYESLGQKWLDTKISTLCNDLLINDYFKARLEKHPIAQFLNRIQMDVSGADISLTSIYDNIVGFNKEVTIRNIISVSPYANTLKVLKMTGKQIKAALEKTANYFVLEDGKITVNPAYIYPKLQHYQYDLWDGIDYTIKVSNPENSKIIKLTYKGKPISPTDTFKVVVSSYRANGGGDYKMFQDAEVIQEIDTDFTEILINYFEHHNYVNFTPIKNMDVIE